MSSDGDLLTRAELADFLKVNPATVLRYISKGMPHLRAPGGELRFERESVVAWMKQDTDKAAANG